MLLFAKLEFDRFMKAFVFPGQGSQFPGMAKDLYENDAAAKSLMEAANEILGFRITDIMFGEDAEALKATRVTQPAVFIHSVTAAFAAMNGENAVQPDMVAGHSLGEYSALCVCGALSFENALKLVAIRAEAMQRCCEAHPGAMAAVIGLPAEQIEEICKRTGGVVAPANYNSDAQTVISGEAEAVNAACETLKAAGAKRALPLQVSGAFHSPLMEPARTELAAAIEQAPVNAPMRPIYQNVSAAAETDPQRIKDNLLKQLTSPVRWTDTVRAMAAAGATEFIELGPGTVLQGLIKRIAH